MHILYVFVGDSNSTTGIISKLSPTAAATGAFMKSGLTLTEVFTLNSKLLLLPIGYKLNLQRCYYILI